MIEAHFAVRGLDATSRHATARTPGLVEKSDGVATSGQLRCTGQAGDARTDYGDIPGHGRLVQRDKPDAKCERPHSLRNDLNGSGYSAVCEALPSRTAHGAVMKIQSKPAGHLGTAMDDNRSPHPTLDPSHIARSSGTRAFCRFTADNAESTMSPALPIRVHDACETVSLDSPHEVRYWTNRFEASAAQVANAVAAVGNSPACVEAWLRESRTSGVVRQDGKWTFLQSAVRNLMFFATGLTGGVMLS